MIVATCSEALTFVSSTVPRTHLCKLRYIVLAIEKDPIRPLTRWQSSALTQPEYLSFALLSPCSFERTLTTVRNRHGHNRFSFFHLVLQGDLAIYAADLPAQRVVRLFYLGVGLAKLLQVPLIPSELVTPLCFFTPPAPSTFSAWHH